MNVPNILTMGRMALIPVFIVLYETGFGLPAAIVFIVASLTDALDGYIARKHDLVTDFGKLMDPLADKVLVMSALLLFIAHGVVPAWTVVIILAREFMVTALRSIAATNGRVLAAGKSGKLKTVFQMVAVVILLLAPVVTRNYMYLSDRRIDSVGDVIGWYAFEAGLIVYYIAVALTLYSGIEYMVKNRDVFSTKQKS
ncbi:MAG: CDP-diacylglycerol--glycerol-3-phosphate 3-phosphatidyltransferase [Clostridiales Family XIII bacterium]|jgi:CDP-diacylglycerol--glycerol-3-phosphate 3-phosphatidyltransferase/cardiolipin synthase|nr:CDP-diacylglycerol--glycerol-3-phosphate 3-phosphatidyltransferase [Clostridiales Family XIII bacterium]